MATKTTSRSGSDTRGRKPRRSSGPRATEYDAYIGERLRLARKMAGITLNDLAMALGVTFQAVQKYESGENRMAAPRLFRAAEILGTNIRFFARPSAAEPAADGTAEVATDELELLCHYRRLGDSQTRLALRKFVEAMADANGLRANARARADKIIGGDGIGEA